MKGSLFRSHAAIACTSVHATSQRASYTPVKKVVSCMICTFFFLRRNAYDGNQVAHVAFCLYCFIDISNGTVLRCIKKKLAGRAAPVKATFGKILLYVMQLQSTLPLAPPKYPTWTISAGGRSHCPSDESDLFEPITSCIAPPRPHTPPLDYSSSSSDESSACSIVERWVSDTSSIYTDDEEKPSAQLSLPYYERLLPQHRVQQLAWNDTATIIIPTWPKSKYDRSPHPHTTYLHLTPLHTEQIRKELNEYKKNEMSVHSDSRIHTAWH